MIKKYSVLVLYSALICFNLDARRTKKNTVQQPACGNDREACQQRNGNCQCYCAFKPGPRNKTVDDTLIFIENDPEGHYCYCKQRDIDKIKAYKQAQQESGSED